MFCGKIMCIRKGKRGKLKMKLIVGLGNPGRKYIGTRHNIGFDCITALCDEYRIKMGKAELKALTGTGNINGVKVMLAMPQTYMNLSGDSVRAIADYYKIKLSDIIIIFDDISLAPGQIRIRKKGSAGGHNGVKDIIAKLRTEEFARIKVGVGAKPEGYDLADFVLGHFSRDEEVDIRKALDKVKEACALMVEDDIDRAMNIYNGKA